MEELNGLRVSTALIGDSDGAHSDENMEKISVLRREPLVATVDGLLSPLECAHMAEVGRKLMPATGSRGQVVGGQTGAQSAVRTARVLWLAHAHDETFLAVAERLARLIGGVPLAHCERFQLIHYAAAGAQYRRHFDAFDGSTEGGQRALTCGGQRITTVLGYLNVPARGGNTVFPVPSEAHAARGVAEISVAPRLGRVLVFNNCAGDSVQRSEDAIHAGAPVEEGEKWAFNLWFRQFPVSHNPVFSGGVLKSSYDSTPRERRPAGSGGAAAQDPLPAVCERILERQEGHEDGPQARVTPYSVALKEISSGRKTGHWIWYVWPTLKGVRTTSRPDLILDTLDDARAYLRHETLGQRLLEITDIATTHLRVSDLPALTLFGSKVDTAKFHEACTVFAVAALANGNTSQAAVFAEALRLAVYGGPNEQALSVLRGIHPDTDRLCDAVSAMELETAVISPAGSVAPEGAKVEDRSTVIAPAVSVLRGRLRVVTFNVHMWFTGEGTRLNVRDVAREVGKLDADVVCLQEVWHDKNWRDRETGSDEALLWGDYRDTYEMSGADRNKLPMELLAELLGMEFIFGDFHQGYGNALLWRAPGSREGGVIASVRRLDTIALPPPADDQRGLQVRVCLGIVVSLAGRKDASSVDEVAVFCTHLDHISEPARLFQLKRIFEYLDADEMAGIPLVLCGDFNSLKRSDYADEFWEETIVAVRKRNNWEPPQTAVTAMLDDRFVDVLGSHGITGKTCAFDTRIDFIWTSKGFPWRCTGALADNDAGFGCSDHSLLYADFAVPGSSPA